MTGRAPRVLLSAGEVSGDRYAAQLVAALRREAGAALEIRAIAGPRTRAAGAALIADSSGRGALGFVAPLRHLPVALHNALRIRRLLRDWPPDVVVLVDYPGFNIPVARLIRGASRVPILYYLPPEECLWGQRGRGRLDRTATLVHACEHLLTTHRVDTAFYQAAGARVTCVGHPLLDLVQPLAHPATDADMPGAGTAVLLAPGSRRQEIGLLWPALAATAAILCRARDDLSFRIPVAAERLAPSLRRACARAAAAYPELAGRLQLIMPSASQPNSTLAALPGTALALSKAGSITLELALSGVPHLMLFRIDRVTEWIGRRLLGFSEQDFPHMALPNFILGETLVPEFKQQAVVPQQMAACALDLLAPSSRARERQLAGFTALRASLGGPGAAQRAARLVLASARRYAAAPPPPHR